MKKFCIVLVSLLFFGCGGGGGVIDSGAPSLEILVPSSVTLSTNDLPYSLPIKVNCSGKDLFNTSCRLVYAKITVDNDYSYDVILDTKLSTGESTQDRVTTLTERDLETNQFIFLTDNNPSTAYFRGEQFVEVLGGTQFFVANLGENICNTTCGCPSGSISSGSVCIVNPTCPSGSFLLNSQCVQNPSCPTGYTFDGNSCSSSSYTCPVGGSFNFDRCVAGTTQPCPAGYSWSGSACIATPICSAGGVWGANQCIATPICPSGSSLSGNRCVFPLTCPSGYTYNANTSRCESPSTCRETCVNKKRFSFNMPNYTPGTLQIIAGSGRLTETSPGILSGSGFGSIRRSGNGYIVEYELDNGPEKDTPILAKYLSPLKPLSKRPVKNLVFMYGSLKFELSENNLLLDSNKNIVGLIDENNYISFFNPIGNQDGVALVKYISNPYNLGGVQIGKGDGINRILNLRTLHPYILRESLLVFTRTQEGKLLIFRDTSGEFTVEFPSAPQKEEPILASYIVTKVIKPIRYDFYDRNNKLVYSKTVSFEVRRAT